MVRIVGVVLLYLASVFQTYVDLGGWSWDVALFEPSLERVLLLAALLYQVARLATNENLRGRSLILWSQTARDELIAVVAAVLVAFGTTEFLGHARTVAFLLALGAIVLPWKRIIIHPRTRRVIVWRWIPRTFSYDELDGLMTYTKTYYPSSEDLSREPWYGEFVALKPLAGRPIVLGPIGDEGIPGTRELNACQVLHQQTGIPLAASPRHAG